MEVLLQDINHYFEFLNMSFTELIKQDKINYVQETLNILSMRLLVEAIDH
jgi:hypothetical protein